MTAGILAPHEGIIHALQPYYPTHAVGILHLLVRPIADVIVGCRTASTSSFAVFILQM